jgi:hypothetical protein
MITLHDYLGGLVASVARARAITDLQTTKVAEDYANNRLLAHFPVPRMRVQSVEMTAPVAIDETQTDRLVDYELDNRSFSALAYREIRDALGVESLPIETSRSLKRMLSEKIKRLEADIRTTGSVAALGGFAIAVAAEAIEIARAAEPIEESGSRYTTRRNAAPGARAAEAVLGERLQAVLRDQIRLRSEREILESLGVTVEADKLRERDPKSLVYIKLVMSEDGVEWHRMETPEGEVVSSLLPE